MKKVSGLQALRESAAAQAVDKVIDGVDRFLGTSGKAWLANGLDELRQAVALGSQQIQAGNSPGLWGTITTGEATAERLAGEKQNTLQTTYEVPEAKQEMSLDELRGYAQRVQEPEQHRDRGQDREMER